jgi:hypothetical protein
MNNLKELDAKLPEYFNEKAPATVVLVRTVTEPEWHVSRFTSRSELICYLLKYPQWAKNYKVVKNAEYINA